MWDKGRFLLFLFLVYTIYFFSIIWANTYLAEVYFTIPNAIYTTGEQIEIKGYVYYSNYSDNGTLVSSHSTVANAIVNLTIANINGTYEKNYTLITDSNGTFYSRSNYYSGAIQLTAPLSAGEYTLRTEYVDPNSTIWFSESRINVINTSIDILRISPAKAAYNPSEIITAEAEAIKIVNGNYIYLSNISINGSLRNSSKEVISNFNCTTGGNGKCTITLTAPSSYGNYLLELNNFKSFGSFYVVPFSVNVYIKDELGQSLKNIFSIGEQGKVEVSVLNATITDSYSFSGYIKDSSGNVVKIITSTSLNNNNSFTNAFLFSIDALTFSYGPYTSHVIITKSGDGSVSSSSSFEVKDWKFSINKKTSGSGFEYEYSVFKNKTMKFEAYPTYRSNGSIIPNISSTFFSINLKDNLNNIIGFTNASWNSSCSNNGCYEFSLTSPINNGDYFLSATLSYNGVSQTETRIIKVIDSVMSTQSTDKDGNLKELFWANEYSYISLTAYNSTSSQFNLTDAEIFLVEYMDGTEFSYSEVSSFNLVNSTNSIYEWAWNSSLQRIKLESPKSGGLYNLYIFGNNQTIASTAKFIVNPYDVCSMAKNTPGQAGGGSGYYYIWQFKTTDTIYFEIKLTQANNPLGKATAFNSSLGNSSSSASYSGCTIDTTQKQAVNNATISILEVKNMESGALQPFNFSESTCKADDSSGGYTCTLKPLSKWDSGINTIKLNALGQDGTNDVIYSRFESKAFYLYGWSQTWQNNPSSNITLNVQMYEAGNGWWGSGSGLSGSITLKKIEYQGRDGEWIYPPVDYDYNASNVNSSSITGSTGTITLSAANAPGEAWKTGYYRAIIQGTTSSGDTDYGYVWFGVKLWDVYGQPVDCGASSCQYKDYFNSKENITIYVKISKAGNYNYNYAGGESIGGNVTISIKKIQDCRTWPCKELNSSKYSASSINVNSSSPWYWNANLNNNSNHILRINTTTGSWGTGWYSVILDINGTDTGYAWFNTIAFYSSVRPTDSNGSNYKYSIKPSEKIFFNITATKNYKGWNVNYNSSDYLNVSISDAVLRTWDEITWQSKEYNYPEDVNISPLEIKGNALVNLSYNNGSWPTGYYHGELTLKNSDNETSTGWIWFDVRPFRVSISSYSYDVDSNQCVNSNINIYEPSRYSNFYSYGNYSIERVYETIWGGYSSSTIEYTNYTSDSFNFTANVTFCPNNNTGEWGTGSWGGYHSLNVVIKDNLNNNTQRGWISFRAVPFKITFGSIFGGTNKLTNENIIIPVSITKYSTGTNTTGNITKIYQWRYDDYMSTKEEYIFSVGTCYSNVSSQCTINGTQNITIYSPSGGWRNGYNYLTTEWSKQNDASSKITDWGGINFDGREFYNGYFENRDVNNLWKSDFMNTENATIKLYVRNSNYAATNVNITDISYSFSSSNCWDE